MDRRWIQTIPISQRYEGAFATKWEGFSRAWIREIGIDRGLTKWNPRRIRQNVEGVWGVEDINQVCGVYVFLAKNDYVLYVGMSTQLKSEIIQKYKRIEPFKRRYIYKVAAHQAINRRYAKIMESDLLWYYTPPWNTRFD
jgi:hypothetical protein